MAYHSRTKHIQRRYHWIRERVEDKNFSLAKVHTEENGSDILTKVLSAERLNVSNRNGKSSHAGVKGEFVGKPVPSDGNQPSLEKEIGPDGSGRNSDQIRCEPEAGTY